MIWSVYGWHGLLWCATHRARGVQPLSAHFHNPSCKASDHNAITAGKIMTSIQILIDHDTFLLKCSHKMKGMLSLMCL